MIESEEKSWESRRLSLMEKARDLEAASEALRGRLALISLEREAILRELAFGERTVPVRHVVRSDIAVTCVRCGSSRTRRRDGGKAICDKCLEAPTRSRSERLKFEDIVVREFAL